MKKNEIIDILEKKHQELFDLVLKKPNDYWMYAPDGKWTVGQHVLHLAQSLELLNKALSYPKFILKYKFGKANRPTRSYDEVAKRYKDKLAANQERAKEFNIKLRRPTLNEKTAIIARVKIQNKKLQAITNKWKDKQLDTVLIPHPLMGRMISREIIMWTAYHTEHHTAILKTHY